MMFYQKRCTGCGKCKEKCKYSQEKCDLCGKCAIYCPQNAREICGREYSAEDVCEEVLKDKSFYENTGGGVTFSGGECMLQIDFLTEVLKVCKEAGIHTAVDTAGFVPFKRFEQVIPYTDLFLYDIKCYKCDKHRRYTGVPNELILENLKKLLELGEPVWVRVPIIPEVNDTEEEMREIKAFLDSCKEPEKVELLPYHFLGEHKYSAIGRMAQRFCVPSDEKMDQLKKIFA